jgi:hypothetical protein
MISYITIPEPCNENWGTMTPNEQGRHCNKCSKTVIDFSAWEPQEIIYYLKAHQSEHLCGRFRNGQLDTPIITIDQFVAHVNHMPLSYLKKVAVVFLFVFALAATSCNSSGTSDADNVSQGSHTKGLYVQPAFPLPADSDKITKARMVPPIALPDTMDIKVNIPVVANIDSGVPFEGYSHTGGAPVVVEPPAIIEAPAKQRQALFSYPREDHFDTAGTIEDTIQ